MRGQLHNQGELSELKVAIEEQLRKDLDTMVENSGYSLDDLVTIALKRFRASHADYMGIRFEG